MMHDALHLSFAPGTKLTNVACPQEKKSIASRLREDTFSNRV